MANASDIIVTIKTKLVLEPDTRLLALQFLGLILLLTGIALWSVPSALIIGGIALIITAEMQPKSIQSLPDRAVKSLLDESLRAGRNPFEDERVPMTSKWLAYAQLVSRKL